MSSYNNAGYEKYLYTDSEYNVGDLLPSDLFIGQNVRRRLKGGTYYFQRHFVRRNRPRNHKLEILIFTDGSCSNNGSLDNAEGSWRIMATPQSGVTCIDDDLSIAEQCEVEGDVVDDGIPPTSNRVKFIAAIEALRSVSLIPSLFRTVVVATDLELITKGMSNSMWRWREHGWLTGSGSRVQNIDLWEELIEEVFKLEDYDIAVKFWKVPRIKIPPNEA
jgi:ribonuclease HI